MWSRSQARTPLPVDAAFSRVVGRLRSQPEMFAPIDAADVASRWRPLAGAGEIRHRGSQTIAHYVWGQGFHTRGADGIYYCEVISDSPNDKGLVRIKTRPDLGRNTKNLTSVERMVESKFLWPLLRGANVDTFSLQNSGLYCIVPHEATALYRVMSVAGLLREAPRLFDYFEEHIDRLVKRSAYDMKIDQEYPWGIQGTAWKHLNRSSTYVACRYMHPTRRPPAAVVVPDFAPFLGFKTTLYPNNKVNFVSCGSLSEADYLATFVNSSPALGFIARVSSSTTIAPSTMTNLLIPRFDSENRLHRQLMEIGQECRLNSDTLSTGRVDADFIVGRIVE